MRHERIAVPQVDRRLAAALVASAKVAGVELTPAQHRSRPWASATFMGARHAMTLVAPRSPALDGWAAGLGETELPLRGHVVASIAVDRVEADGDHVSLHLDVLTLEDG